MTGLKSLSKEVAELWFQLAPDLGSINTLTFYLVPLHMPGPSVDTNMFPIILTTPETWFTLNHCVTIKYYKVKNMYGGETRKANTKQTNLYSSWCHKAITEDVSNLTLIREENSLNPKIFRIIKNVGCFCFNH